MCEQPGPREPEQSSSIGAAEPKPRVPSQSEYPPKIADLNSHG